jgi:hypothetical protein
MKSLRLSLLFLFAASSLSAQTILFPGLEGPELVDSVASHFRPDSVLDYSKARDTMYAKVLAMDDDSLRCIYTGHTLYLDPTQDPTQYVFLGGGSNGINAEHAYPQSKGAAEGNARSDMHHLYPSRVPVNEARGSVPYANIPDALTQKWFIGNQLFTTIPTVNVDGYTESRNDAFEPRESVKGDVARSVFYFYTMYRAQANAADPDFFELQRPTLCQWAEQDPADAAELLKTWRIAPYQAGKPNPFVVDCTLASRCWCPAQMPDCLVGTLEPARAALGVRVSPNPARAAARVEAMLPFAGRVQVRVLSVLGQAAVVLEWEDANEGAWERSLDLSGLEAGVWLLEVSLSGPKGRAVERVPLVLLR